MSHSESNAVLFLEPPRSRGQASELALAVIPRREPHPAGQPDAWLDHGRIPSLDGIRCVAVLLVMLTHAAQTRGFPKWGPLDAIAHHGSVGVEVFFVVSGFLITTLLLRELDRSRTVDLWQFYVRRSFRILPAYFVLLGVVAVLQAIGCVRLELRDWVAAWTYTMNFLWRPAWEVGHVWSLSIEEHFYILWPVVMLALGSRCAIRAACGCLAACFFSRWIVLLWFPESTPMAELWTFTRLDTIALGCLLALVARNGAARQLLDRLTSPMATAAVWIVLCGSLSLSWSGKYSVGFGFSVNAACIALLLWGVVRRPRTWFGRLLNHPWLGAVGVRSYSLYLWQQLFLNPVQSAWVCTFPQNAIVAVLAGCLSYWLIEQPFLSLKGNYLGIQKKASTGAGLPKK